MGGDQNSQALRTKDQRRDDPSGRSESTNRLSNEAWGRDSLSNWRAQINPPREPFTEANMHLRNLVEDSKKSAGQYGKPKIEAVQPNLDDKKFGATKALVVRSSGSTDGQSKGWQGTVKHIFDAEGKWIGFDYLNNKGQVTADSDKAHVNSFRKIDGEWKRGNYKTGKWETMAMQQNDFSAETGDMTIQRSIDELNICGADGSMRKVSLIPGPNGEGSGGRVTFAPNGKVESVERPDEKLAFKYKTIVKDGKAEEVVDTQEVLRPTRDVYGVKHWEHDVTYTSSADGKTLNPDKPGVPPIVDFALDQTNGNVSYSDRNGPHVATANGQHFDTKDAQYEFNKLGQVTAVKPSAEQFAKGVPELRDITYNSSGQRKSFKSLQQTEVDLGNGYKATSVRDGFGYCTSVKVTRDGADEVAYRRENSDGKQNIIETKSDGTEITWTRQPDREWRKPGQRNNPAERIFDLDFNSQGLKTWRGANKQDVHTQLPDKSEKIQFASGVYKIRDANDRVVEAGAHGIPKLKYEHNGGEIIVSRSAPGKEPVKIGTITRGNGGGIRDDGGWIHKEGEQTLVESPSGTTLTYRAGDELLTDIVLPSGVKGSISYTDRPLMGKVPDSIVYKGEVTTKEGKGTLTRGLKIDAQARLADRTGSQATSHAQTVKIDYEARDRGARPPRAARTDSLTSTPSPRMGALKLDQKTGDVGGNSANGDRVEIPATRSDRTGKGAVRPVPTPRRYREALTNFAEVRPQVLEKVKADMEAQRQARRPAGDLAERRGAAPAGGEVLPRDEESLNKLSKGYAYWLAQKHFPDQFRDGPQGDRDSFSPRNFAEFDKIARKNQARAAFILELAERALRGGEKPI